MKVSILSAVHNEEAFISEMISSVRDQTHTDWELLFVSDGSTDATEDLVREAAALDHRIRLVRGGSKIGKVDAFNTAFAASSGEIVVLLAGDDTIPATSLSDRLAEFEDVDPSGADVVAFFKLRTMSQNPRQNGATLPRGTGGGHSGGTLAMTRHLAERVFPVDSSLVSEDLWLVRASEGMGEVRENRSVVLNYRIHAHNSNPRNQDFATMHAAMTERHRAWGVLLESKQLDLEWATRLELEQLRALEDLRLEGRLWRIVRYREARWVDRLAYAAMAHPLLFRTRRKFFRVLSGRRGR